MESVISLCKEGRIDSIVLENALFKIDGLTKKDFKELKLCLGEMDSDCMGWGFNVDVLYDNYVMFQTYKKAYRMGLMNMRDMIDLLGYKKASMFI